MEVPILWGKIYSSRGFFENKQIGKTQEKRNKSEDWSSWSKHSDTHTKSFERDLRIQERQGNRTCPGKFEETGYCERVKNFSSESEVNPCFGLTN